MKRTNSNTNYLTHRLLRILPGYALALAGLAWLGQPLASPAATQYGAGTFTWDNAITPAWAAASGGPYSSVWTSGNDAVLEGTAGTVGIAAAGATAHSIAFNTTGYTVQNNTLTLNGSSPTLTLGAGISGTIGSVVGGSAGLTKAGTGTLRSCEKMSCL